jgi:hypothetical protein
LSPASRSGGRPSAVVARLLRAVAAVETRRSQLREALDVVTRIEPTRLVFVNGERQFLRTLELQAEQLGQVIADLDEVPPGPLEPVVVRLEELLGIPEWSLLEPLLEQLKGSYQQVTASITDLKSAYGPWPQRAGRLVQALAGAQEAGAVEVESTRAARKIITLVQQAEQDEKSGNYGGLSVRLARIERHLSDSAGGGDGPAAAAEHLLAQLEQARDRAAPLRDRADLVLMQGPEGQDGVIDYRLLLRVPAVDLPQEVNLTSQSVLVKKDRDEVLRIIERITAAVDSGIRRAHGPSATAAPTPTETPTRRFDLGGSADPDAIDVSTELRDIGRLMYSLLVPDAMQRLISDARSSLTLATNDMEMPWELLHDGTEFLCLERSMARMPLGGTLPRRRRERAGAGSGETLRVLVVAADSMPDQPLPGVAKEAEQITRRLEERFGPAVKVRMLVGDDATGGNLNRELRSGEHHVIHYAGHALFDKANPERSALVLAGQERYFAQKIQRILEGRPVVMINACDSGQTRNQPGSSVVTSYLAEENHGLASAFIYGGAAACVGALWPVYDDTAVDLAVNFYDHFLSGGRVGEALRTARERSVKDSPDRVTWASYALFGDPTFSLPIAPVTT